MTKAHDLTGKKFGRLTVMRRAENKKHRVQWLCICDCGRSPNVVSANNLQQGKTQSCGCLKRERVSSTNSTHGHTRGYKRIGKFPPEYSAWMRMRSRCNNPGSNGYQRYGGRGIRICKRWNDFENFLADMGPRPSSHHSLDRIDVNADYSPENCRWATSKEQSNNRRSSRLLTIGDRTQTLTEWAREIDVSAGTLSARIERGWSSDRLFRPTRPSKYHSNVPLPRLACSILSFGC